MKIIQKDKFLPKESEALKRLKYSPYVVSIYYHLLINYPQGNFPRKSSCNIVLKFYFCIENGGMPFKGAIVWGQLEGRVSEKKAKG